MVIFPVKDFFLDVSEEEPYILAQNFVGKLAQIYLKNPDKDKVVVIELPPEKLAFCEALVVYLSKSPWIRIEKLSDLTHYASTNQIELKTNIPEEEKKYYDYLNRYHRLAKSFLETLLPDNPQRTKVKNLLYLAEGIFSEDLEKQKEDINPFLREIDNTVKENWDKLKISSGVINLTSQSGKIPLSIQNRSNTPFKVKIRLVSNSKKLTVKEEEREVIINPKDNTFLIPVSAKEPGEYEVNVRLLTPESESTIREGRIIIKSTYFIRMLSLWLWLILIIVVLLIIREKRRKRGLG